MDPYSSPYTIPNHNLHDPFRDSLVSTRELYSAGAILRNFHLGYRVSLLLLSGLTGCFSGFRV